MFCKFVGKDGSMGLKHGRVYDCILTEKHGYYWMIWDEGECPYYTMQSLRRNWELWQWR